MALILSCKYAGKSTWSFYRSRMLRLFPGYWLACIVTIVVLTATRQTRLFDYWQSLVIDQQWQTLILNAISSLFLVGQEWARFADNSNVGNYLLPQAWTLSVEIMFYLMAPWLMRRRTLTLASLAAVAVLARAAVFRAGLLDYEYSCYFGGGPA